MNEGLSACFAGLPKFASVNGTLRAAGWNSQEGAEPGEYELEKGDANVFVFPGNRYSNPGCTVSSTFPRKSAEALLEQHLDARFKGAWQTAPTVDGIRSWVVPLRGGSLVMHVLGSGNSGEGSAGSGISMEVRAKR
ncbi:hypothetical protein [Paracoccus sp. (in: a-proteobacteria)]|uniref:hypothetical protein n=1 Tax=Paracoccus sp. TaxID=267 RepID=UPI0032202472